MISSYNIDKELQRILRPLNFILKLFGTPKYRIQNGRNIPIDKKSLTIWFLTVIIASVYCSVCSVNNRRSKYNMLNFVNVTYDFFLCFGYTISLIGELSNRQNNCSIIILFHKIHRSIKFSKEIQTLVVWIWFHTFTTVFYGFIVVVILHIIYTDMLLIGVICDSAYMTFDLNLVYAISILMLLNKYMDEWVKSVLMFNEEQEDGDNMDCQHLLETYLDIMKAYNLYKKIFRILVLYYSVDTFFRTVTYVESVLQLLRLQVNPQEIVDETSMVCTQLMKNLESSNNQIDLYKKVLQTNFTFTKMTACGLFYIDATLPISLLLLTTNYVIVLLQFAFL
ncbi:hypothetical protein SFRURICE_016973 [Spodoptera frugiperda]|nr:hypothetical protein SFRURICE_016973 [Spodoptera frugiperda]